MKFLSQSDYLRIVIEPAYYKYYGPNKRKRISGKVAQFEDGVFETEDEELINSLLEHDGYGITFFSPEVKKRADKEAVKKAEKEKKERLEKSMTSCPYCSFNAKTKSGLTNHIRFKHPKEYEEKK